MDEQKNTAQLLEQLGCKLDKIICLLESRLASKEISVTALNARLEKDAYGLLESLKNTQRRQKALIKLPEWAWLVPLILSIAALIISRV